MPQKLKNLLNGHGAIVSEVVSAGFKLLVLGLFSLGVYSFNQTITSLREGAQADRIVLERISERLRLLELSVASHHQADTQTARDIERRLNSLEVSVTKQWSRINERRK